ncbi:MAG: hypothetical protein GX638_12965 [Crenarchaeota archaeon]|nr:hypothetical protein [Thermoproteota archaeon]
MKKLFLFTVIITVFSILLIPLSIYLSSDILLIIGLFTPIFMATISLILFWEYTMQFPRNDLCNYEKISIPAIKNRDIELEFTYDDGTWCYRNRQGLVNIDLKGYLFPVSFIKAYIIRQIRYQVVNQKLPLASLFKKKLFIKKYDENNIYLKLVKHNKTKRVIILKKGVSINSFLSQIISQSSYYSNYLFMRSVVSLNRNKSFINESIYDNRRRKNMQ